MFKTMFGSVAALALAALLVGAESAPEDRTVVITGANRGIGLAFAQHFAEAGWQVIGTARRPDAAEALSATGARIEKLDVADVDSIAAFAEAIGDAKVDLLINNAGIIDRNRELAATDLDVVEQIIRVNTLGPMRVTQALLPALHRGEGKTLINITSGLGSIENAKRAGFYGYRESKAALNMFTRNLAAELGSEGFVCLTMSPGWVRTDMGGPNANLSPAESVAAMTGVIDKLTPEDNGRFVNHNGEPVPW